jgi:hypothetical protein
MSERLLPEAIRGSWYMLAEKGSPEEALAQKGQLLGLHLDGEFVRYEVDASNKKEKERGDYTFDGDFLILRGRNTDTFRVHVEANWYWFLEAKKKSRRLFRGILEADDFFELDEEDRGEISERPTRVKVTCRYDDETDAIFDLVFRPKGGQAKRIGCFSVDPDPENATLWVGLTPLATNLDAEVWEKIIRKAYLNSHLGKPAEIGWVSLEFLGDDSLAGDSSTREFDSQA